jgi:hypothetical protein
VVVGGGEEEEAGVDLMEEGVGVPQTEVEGVVEVDHLKIKSQDI